MTPALRNARCPLAPPARLLVPPQKYWIDASRHQRAIDHGPNKPQKVTVALKAITSQGRCRPSTGCCRTAHATDDIGALIETIVTRAPATPDRQVAREASSSALVVANTTPARDRHRKIRPINRPSSSQFRLRPAQQKADRGAAAPDGVRTWRRPPGSFAQHKTRRIGAPAQ